MSGPKRRGVSSVKTVVTPWRRNSCVSAAKKGLMRAGSWVVSTMALSPSTNRRFTSRLRTSSSIACATRSRLHSAGMFHWSTSRPSFTALPRDSPTLAVLCSSRSGPS